MYALTTHSTSAKLAWNERAIDGKETATTLVSRTINAHVADAVARTNAGLASGSGAGEGRGLETDEGLDDMGGRWRIEVPS
jgi:hypothetical protein